MMIKPFLLSLNFFFSFQLITASDGRSGLQLDQYN
jgi:hypothetical protein